MINKISYVLVFMLFICAGFIACTDDDKVKITEFTLTLTEPEDLNVTSISDLHGHVQEREHRKTDNKHDDRNHRENHAQRRPLQYHRRGENELYR